MKRIGLIIFATLFIHSVGWAQSQDSVRLSLQQAVQEALSHNELLKKAESRVQASRSRLQQAKGQMLPKVNANLTYGYLDMVPGFKQQLLDNSKHDILPSLSITQPVYTGGKMKYSKNAAEAAFKSKEAIFQNEQVKLKYQVTLLYYNLQSLQNQIQIVKENRRRMETHQQYARLLVSAGRMSQLELDRIATSIANLDGKLLKLKNDYQQNSYQLGVLLGRDEHQVYVPTDSLKIVPFELQEGQLLPLALKENPVWRQLEWGIKKAEAVLRVQQAPRLPQVSATAWYGYEFGLGSSSFDKNKRYFVGLNVKMPIYDGGVIKGKIEEARAGLAQLQWEQRYFMKNLSVTLNNGYTRLKEMEKQIAIQKKALVHAQQSYRLALIEYQAGRRSNTDLLDIQNALLNSKLAANQAMLDYNVARARLLAVVGIL